MKTLIIAPHPDDEILGCGGTIARLSHEGDDVYVAILTKAGPPLFEAAAVEQGRKDALSAHKLLGVRETFFCDLPAAHLDTIPHSKINETIGAIFKKLQPKRIFIPFWGDIHLDHQNAFLAALVAARPNQANYPVQIYAYETLSETNWHAPFATLGFQPNVFIDISDFLELKLQAFSLHTSQVKTFPHERSLKALQALATLRGSTVHRHAAEAFILIREVL